MTHDVFISYSSEDKTIANAVCATLEGMGTRCWIAPRDVAAGVEYAESLVDAIHCSRLMVLVFSSRSNGSPHVLREVERAVSRGLPIVPLRIEDVPLSKSMEHYISSVHWLDAIPPSGSKYLTRLGETVQMVLSRSTSTESAGSNDSSAGQVTDAGGFLGNCLILWDRHRRAATVGLVVFALAVFALLFSGFFRDGGSSPRDPREDVVSGPADAEVVSDPADVEVVSDPADVEVVSNPADVENAIVATPEMNGGSSPQDQPEDVAPDPADVENAILAIQKMKGQAQRGGGFDRSVTFVRINGEHINDACAAYLKPLTSVTHLDLTGTRVTDAGLENLSGMTHLVDLSIGGTGVRGSGLAHLRGASKLRELNALHTPLTDTGLKHLTGKAELQILRLTGTRITDAGLEHLSGLTSLVQLDLSQTQVGDAGLKHLKGLTNLKLLNLAGTQVGDEGLKHLKGLTNLQGLTLHSSKVTSAGVEELKSTLPWLDAQGVGN